MQILLYVLFVYSSTFSVHKLIFFLFSFLLISLCFSLLLFICSVVLHLSILDLISCHQLVSPYDHSAPEVALNR